MAIDLLIVLFLAVLVAKGYSTGFMHSLGSIASAALGIWLALRKCDPLAMVLDGLLHNVAAARVISFVFLLLLFWLALRGARRLLYKLVDWQALPEFDHYVGGLFGLCRGVALVWVLLAGCLAIFPSSVRFIERSNASLRILSLGESESAPEPTSLAAAPVGGNGSQLP